MIKTKPDKHVEETFAKMKRECYAQSSGIVYTSEVPRAAIDMATYEIMINPESFKEFLNMTPEQIAAGYLQHEYQGHLVNHPFDVKRVVAESIALQNMNVDDNKANFVRNRFDDIVANLKVWNYYDARELASLYANFKSQMKYDDVEKNLYQIILETDIGVKPDKEIKAYAEKLRKIDFLSGRPIKNIRECEAQIKRFYKVIEPLLKDVDSKNESAFGDIKMSDIPSKEIEKAVKSLAVGGDVKLEDAKKFLKEYAKNKGINEKKSGKPKEFSEAGNSFSNNPDVYANQVIYDGFSEQYTLRIKKLPIKTNGGLYPSGYEDWESSDSVEKMDPFASFGLIAPGITKKTTESKMSTYGKGESVPDLFILLDDSGSMPNPTENVSSAVLASFVAAKNYVRNGAEVGVSRFSDRTTEPVFSKYEKKALEELLKFKSGGATNVDIDIIDNKISNRKNKLDAILITDGQISNRSAVVNYLSTYNRAFMFEIGKSGNPKKEEKVIVYPISKPEDIAKIIIDEVV